MTSQLKILLLVFLPLASFGQTMQSIFKLLPIDCVEDLDSTRKEELLSHGKYIIPGGDSIETVQYTIEDISENYLAFGFSFTTGQNGFAFFELKRFRKADGANIIIFSRYGGLLRSFSQHDLKVFYLKNNQLIEDKHQKLLPQNISIDNFLKKQTPDSIRLKIEQCMNGSYNLNSELENSIEFTNFSQCLSNEYTDWLVGYSFRFTWTGAKFVKKLIGDN